MLVRRLVAVILRRGRRRRDAHVPITPEFGVRVMLREGDRVVRRTADGEIEVKTITRGHEREM
jgi:hypothetical protein